MSSVVTFTRIFSSRNTAALARDFNTVLLVLNEAVLYSLNTENFISKSMSIYVQLNLLWIPVLIL